jgi:hypothetical protein
MENEELLECITYWDKQIKKDNNLCDVAMMKIFVKLERFIILMFKNYSTGIASGKGYTAERKLLFEDYSHLDNFLSIKGGSFIDYLPIIQKFSKFIFLDNRNPFDLIFADDTLKNIFEEIRAIRNYVAHESQESISKYKRTCLSGNNDFIEPKIYLNSLKMSRSKSYYSFYIEKVKEISEILLESNLYF